MSSKLSARPPPGPAPWSASSGRLRHRPPSLFHNRFFDVAELVLAEEHFLADKERRRAEGAAVDRISCQLEQFLFHIVLLCPRHQPVGIEPGGFECGAE